MKFILDECNFSWLRHISIFGVSIYSVIVSENFGDQLMSCISSCIIVFS